MNDPRLEKIYKTLCEKGYMRDTLDPDDDDKEVAQVVTIGIQRLRSEVEASEALINYAANEPEDVAESRRILDEVTHEMNEYLSSINY